MEKFKAIVMLFVASVSLLTFSSCQDSEEELSGWYVNPNADEGGGGAYNFVNAKNVEVYVALFTDKYGIGDWMRQNKVTVNGKQYYYNYMSNYTYTYKDDVIYIPMAGQILNKSGNTLRRDGSSETFVKR